jgi:hypothetical protein
VEREEAAIRVTIRPWFSTRCDDCGARSCPESHRPRWAHRRQQKTAKLERVMPPVVRVTERTHPLFGKTLTLLSERCGRGKGFVAVRLEDSSRRLVRRSATDLDSGKRPGPPMSRISARSLLPLARHVQCYLAGGNVEGVHANRLRSGSVSPTPSTSSTQHPTAPASAGSRITRSPRSARSADRKDPAAQSHRGLRSC